MTVPTLHPAAQALAQSLALAHIEQVRQRLLDPSADSLPARLLQQWIDQVGPLQVNQLADQASVEAVVRDYAFELDLGGGLVELLGLMARRIGLETMDTAAACRTYNILAGEGRNVVAALILETGT